MITENNFYFTKTSNFICTQIEWEAFWFISDIKQLFLVSKITEDKVKSYTILHNCEFARVGKVNKKLQKKKKKTFKYYLYLGSLMIIFIACSHEALEGTRWKPFNVKN